MLKRVREMRGKRCYICEDLFGMDKKVFEYMRPNAEWCGITYIDCEYYFEHEGKFYCYQYEYDSMLKRDMVEFENNIINLYEQFGNWYDAFGVFSL